MSIISASSCICFCFEYENDTTSNYDISEVEVFYAKTKELSSGYTDFRNYVTHDEKMRANKFHFDEDRETYLSCHALLRLILSRKLNKKPSEISFINEINNKPGLMGGNMYFNITHTREAFAFAISKYFYVGIDLEKVNRNVDFTSIIETYFSNHEREYILESKTEARNRFFLLWTRKEALLKALGIGIISDLPLIEVSGERNIINKKLFDRLVSYPASSEHFIYSKRVSEYYLSIAIPQKAEIVLNHINTENLSFYLV